jgi:hypothetical protein
MFQLVTVHFPARPESVGSSYEITLVDLHFGHCFRFARRLTWTTAWQFSQMHGKRHVVLKLSIPPPFKMLVSTPHLHFAMTFNPILILPSR